MSKFRNKLEANMFIARMCREKNIPIIPNVIYRFNRILFSCEIPIVAGIDPTVNFLHNGLGVVVNEEAIIGKNTRIMHNVTIGANYSKRKKVDGIETNSPIIGESVFIGAGAIIVGPIKIGDHAKIGAGSVVMNDVPDFGIAVGVPAKLVKIDSLADTP